MFRSTMLSLPIVICGLATTAAWANTVNVAITDYAFSPEEVTVHPGDTIIWTNGDSVPHTATARDGKSFDTGAIDPSSSAKVVFSKLGHYDYYCTVHPEMHGSVDVK